MEQQGSELSTRLATTVEDWKHEVGTAQQALVAQFDTSNRQLGRLLQVLTARQEQATALAAAREELARLRATQPANALPPGSVTDYGAPLSPETEAMGRDLAKLMEKLAATVRAWTAEVTQAHVTVNAQIQRMGNTLDALMAAMEPRESHAAVDPQLTEAVNSLREELAALRDTEARRETEAGALRAENDELKERIAVAETTCQAAEARADEADAALGTATTKLEETEKTARELQKQVDEARAAADAAAAERDRLRVTLREHEEVVTTLESQVSELMHARRAVDSPPPPEERTNPEKDFEDLHLELETMKAEARVAQDENARLELELRELKAALTEREAALEEAQSRAAQFEARADHSLAQAEAARECREQLNTAESWIEELERQVAELSGAKETPTANAAEEIGRLEAELAEKEQRIAALERRVIEAQGRNSTSPATLDAFLDSLEDVEATDTTAREDEAALMETVLALLPESEAADHAPGSPEGDESRMRLGQVLIEAGAITEEELQVALLEKQQRPDIPLGTLLLNHGYISEEGLAEALARQLGLAMADPTKESIDPAAAACGERGLCTWHVCVPLRIEEGKLITAMSNPLDEEAMVRLGQRAGMEVVPVVATASRILTAIEQAYGVF